MAALTVPFGVSSRARALPELDGKRFTVASSKGARLIDTEGRSYVDYGMAMGATLLGHAHPAVVEACTCALANGPMPGFPNDIEEPAGTALVRIGGARLTRATFATTGTEAVHLACRIARGATGRRLIAKPVGGYDGWFDPLRFGLVESPEAERTNNRPVKEDTTLFRVNEIDDVDQLFDELGSDLAAILIEPMLGNTGCLVPDRSFFEHLTKRAQENGTLIIADEVMVGLRRGVKLVSEDLGLTPDLATFGKAIGSGVPVAAVLGTPKAFEVVDNGQVSTYGTYHGNPLVASAVLATMKLLEDESAYSRLFDWGAKLRAEITAAFGSEGIAATTTGFDSVFSLWFTDQRPRTYDEAQARVNPEAMKLVSDTLRRNGVIGLPTVWGRFFVSLSHGDAEMDITIRAFREAAHELARSGIKL